MKKITLVISYLLLVNCAFGQKITQKLEKAWQQFEADSQLRHAISSLYVVDAKTGKVLFDKNSQIGLAPASTQKIITAVTAFELLGQDYKYKTEFGFYPNDVPVGPITVKSFGDPTFGSPRYNSTKPEIIRSSIIQKAKDYGRSYSGMFQIDNTSFESQAIPNGWIMQDIGNYYGAGAAGLNWRENQFDLLLRSTERIGDSVKIVSVNGNRKPVYPFVNELKSAAKGTGDNAYIYLPIDDNRYVVRGTIPAGEKNFVISGAVTDACGYFAWEIGTMYSLGKAKKPVDIFYTYYSPPLDSIIYWFLKKSINLYGESLVKTFAYEKNGFGSTDSGIVIIKDFWKERSLDDEELNMIDGSGLSPQNRVTTHAQVEILRYAKGKSWFPSFYDALPEYNGMKMKSGSISDVKGYCGYQKSADGNEYIFSFLVNNYNGRSSAIVNKMYKVLDILK